MPDVLLHDVVCQLLYASVVDTFQVMSMQTPYYLASSASIDVQISLFAF